jgi:hypothetical protein
VISTDSELEKIARLPGAVIPHRVYALGFDIGAWRTPGYGGEWRASYIANTEDWERAVVSGREEPYER